MNQMDWTEHWNRPNWSEIDWLTEIDQMDRIGLKWIELDRTGHKWTKLNRMNRKPKCYVDVAQQICDNNKYYTSAFKYI